MSNNMNKPRRSVLSWAANLAWIAGFASIVVPRETVRAHPWIEVLGGLAFLVFAVACVIGLVRVLAARRGNATSDPVDADKATEPPREH